MATHTSCLLLILILLYIITSENISCHVTDRVRNVDQMETVSTQVPLQTETTVKGKSDKKDSSKTVDVGNSVYLDDVIFSLRNQNWTDKEEPCREQIYKLVDNLQNFTLWAVWEWDAQASEPLGLLYGNRHQLGNFDQCMKAPWSQSHPELRTKYCLADIVLERTDKAIRHRVEGPYPYESALDFIEYRAPHTRPLNELTWGVCVPSACEPRTVGRLLKLMLARSHLGTAGITANISITEDCQNSGEQKEYDGLFYGFFGLMGSLTFICIICTYLGSDEKRLNPDARITHIIRAFNLKENARDLLRVKKEGLEVFYGIRFLTMCFIVMDHQIGLQNAGPTSDGYRVDREMATTIGLLILHDDLFVDTFFLLSGFLSATALVSFKRLPNLPVLILKRYVRLVIAYAVVIFFIAAVFPYTGSGPLWNRGVGLEASICRENWWHNLLMISNYIDPENMCLVVTWYIPCDFHFFIVSLIVFYIYKSLPRVGITLMALLTAAAIIIPGVINYINKLPAIQLFTFEFVANPRGSPNFQLSYITSHTRYAAYLVGAYFGYIYFVCKNKGTKIKQVWAVLGSLAAIALMLVVMIFGSTYLWRHEPIEAAVYAALNRPVWAIGVGLIVLCCYLSHVPIIKPFLTWYPFVPLSRMAYGLYLTHTVLIMRNVFNSRDPQSNDAFERLTSTAGVIVWGCVAALIIFLLAEAPANNLLMLCLNPKSLKPKVIESSPTMTPNTSLDAAPTHSNGQLQDNLPSTIVYSSKI